MNLITLRQKIATHIRIKRMRLRDRLMRLRAKLTLREAPPTIEERSKFDHSALWSSPASGNHWVRFIVEYLTGCPTCGSGHLLDWPIFMNKFPGTPHPLAHVDPKAPYVLYKSHWPYQLTNKSNLLLLVRDFHEVIGANKDRINDSNNILKFLRFYIELIEGYERFPGTKMLVYYEDLIQYPEREISRIKNFLAAPEARYETFMNRYDYYAKLSRQGRNRIWAGAHSGTNIQFHQENMHKEKLVILIKIFYEVLACPEYQRVKPYLARYL